MDKTAVIAVDVINTYDHDDADLLLLAVESALPAMVDLLERAWRHDVGVIYANDTGSGGPTTASSWRRPSRGHTPLSPAGSAPTRTRCSW
ncbi:hypothetical protein ACWCPS_38045 [Streptomyces mauvecolor]